MNFTDTIAAIATPIGEGGIGIIRISGPKALSIGRHILRTPKSGLFSTIEPRRVYYGYVVDPEQEVTLDEVLFFYAPKPRSFTAEDVIEIQAHGGTLVLSKILQQVLRSGARLAEPGEFTMRAFINGRIDLVQAESVIDLIRAKTDKAHQLALSQLNGRATRYLQQIESNLYQILVNMEALLDFPEEGIPDLEKARIQTEISQIIEKLQQMLATVDEGRKIREGIQITIVGRPNVGKSSLLNALSQEEKAIVTDIPGTTRDIVDVQLQLRGIPIVLNDTAGLRETDNPIEQIGIQRAEQSLEQSQFILAVFDISQPLNDEDRFVLQRLEGKKVLVVLNKADLQHRLSLDELSGYHLGDPVLVSSLTGEGIERLEQRLVEEIGVGNLQVDDRPMLSRLRHRNALETAIEALQSFNFGLEQHQSEDLLAVDLRSALSAIGEITGKNVNEEVLHGIFASFCIGK
ncbi:MAG TPA: tRNA uridine-5-carboxymethylaminomethyl(34) synthesis GTPase MnmE [Bacillota bacterium]|nr:tRNA uridine-5-carboxymethylaminomethyl(34) synthesis GTPase MnmE [Bacillota bacterium]HPT86342.1 tRNA uridine-5-carboxymethylaminomethyl(34) synthesis GTPase MnmE [Bacillota bacterium]